MISAAALLCVLLVGAALGALGLARWWTAKMRDPAYAREALQGLHKTAGHPHWLQVSKTDERRVCPCCGWTEGAP